MAAYGAIDPASRTAFNAKFGTRTVLKLTFGALHSYALPQIVDSLKQRFSRPFKRHTNIRF